MENIDPNIVVAGVFILVLLFLGVVYAAITLMGGSARKTRDRLDRFKARFSAQAKGGPVSAILKEQGGGSFDAALKEMIPKPAELRTRLDKTGRQINLTNYVIASGLLGAIVLAILSVMMQLPLILAIFGAVAVGIGLPHLAVAVMIKQRIEKFTKLFPEAIDLIVRGLKSGLPVTESMAAVGREVEDPVGIEFRKVSEAITLGKSIDDSLWSASDRLDTPDFKFFVISLSVQQETGGNLAETLQNLSDILRRRQQLKLKIKAMAAEGKASAYIIGSLPFVLYFIISSMNPSYTAVLFTDPRALIITFGGLVWMSIGGFIIWKMINFEI